MSELIHPLHRFFRPSVTHTTFCPGCGDGTVVQCILRAIDGLGMDMDDFVFVSGIGCAAWIPSPLFNADVLHTTHGRPIAFAFGIKMGLPDKKVMVVSGDGDLADLLRLDAEEEGQLRHPLVKQRPPVHQDQRAAGALRDEVRADDGLAHARWSDEDAEIVLEECTGSLALKRGQLPLEPVRERSPSVALVVHVQLATVLVEEILEVGATASRQGDVLR